MLSQILKLFKNLIFIGQKFFHIDVQKIFNPPPFMVFVSPHSFFSTLYTNVYFYLLTFLQVDS